MVFTLLVAFWNAELKRVLSMHLDSKRASSVINQQMSAQGIEGGGGGTGGKYLLFLPAQAL